MSLRWPSVLVVAAVGSAACVNLAGLSGGRGSPDASALDSAAGPDASTEVVPFDAFADATAPQDTSTDGTALLDRTPVDVEADARVEATMPADTGSDVDEESPPECEDASAVAILPAQNNATGVGAATTASVQLSQPLLSHDLLVVEFDFDGSTESILSVADTDGNTFHPALSVSGYAGATFNIYYAEDVATSGAPDTVTVTLTSASQSYIELYALEYRGIVASNALDVTASNSGSSTATDGMQSGARVTSAPHELVFGFGAAGSAAAGTNFQARNGYDSNIAEDRVVTCIGSYQTTGTANSGGWTMMMATFRGN